MRSTLLFIILCSALWQLTFAQQVNITVIYESLCPDSKDFVVNQLYPVLNSTLKNAIIIDLVPYGKAETFPQTNGSFAFKCQHGPRECFANMYQVCAIEHYGMELATLYAQCIMSKSKPDRFVTKCATSSGLDADTLTKCQSGFEGPRLLKEAGDRTTSLKPRMVFVPWIIFDGKFNKSDQDKAQVNLREVVCSKFPSNQKPTGC